MKGACPLLQAGAGNVATWKNTGNWGDLKITSSGVVSIKPNVIEPTHLKGIGGSGSTGATILSDGSGGFDWGKPNYDMDDLGDVAAPSPADNDILNLLRLIRHVGQPPRVG